MGYEYKKGQSSFDTAPTGKPPRFDDEFKVLVKPAVKQHKDIRAAGGVTVLKVHFVPIKGRDGENTGFYALCPNWDVAAQDVREDFTCPACRDFGAFGLPENVRIKMASQYYFHAFDLTVLKKQSGEIHFGLVMANGKNWDDLGKAQGINEGVPANDPKQGCILHWSGTPSEFKKGSTEFSFSAGNRQPIAYDEDKCLWKIKVDGKIYTGEEQDLLSILPEADANNLGESLEKHGYYARLEEAGGLRRKGTTATTKKPGKPPVEEEPDLDDEDLDEADAEEDDTPPAKPAKKPAAKKPPVEEEDDLDSDDDLDAADEEDDPPAKPAKKPAKKAPVEEEDDLGGDDDLDDADAEEEDDPKPAKKPSKKAPVVDEDDDLDNEPADDDADEELEEDDPPAKPAKKPGKKAPVVDDDDDFDTDLEGLEEDDPPAKPAKKPSTKKPAKDEEPDDDLDGLDDEPPAKPAKKPRK